MYAIEFETNITSPFIPLHNYEQFLNQQVKVIVMAQDEVKPANQIIKQSYDFSDLQGKLTWSGDAVAQQRSLRDEW